MRTTLIVLAVSVVLLLAAAGYGYVTNPAGCAKLGTDLIAIFSPPLPAPPETTTEAKIALKPALPHTPVAPTSTSVAKKGPTPATNIAMISTAPAAVALSTGTASAEPAEATLTAFKPWAPPDTLPAQPNWTWSTPDKNYENVVVTKIEPETVTITHSMGVAHIPISTLPADIQKQLNYDPQAAAAAKTESERESSHPYYSLPALAEAKDAARKLHWPLAWVCSDLSEMKVVNPPPDSEEELTQMVMNNLKTRSIIIFLDSNPDIALTPRILVDQGFYQLDDGFIPGGHHFYAPKIVFSDVDATKVLGRVSHTQLLSSRINAIDKVMQSIVDTAAPTEATSAGPAAAAPVPTAH